MGTRGYAISLGTGLLAVAALIFGQSAMADNVTDPPPPPPGVDEHGVGTVEGLPREIPVVDKEGNIVGSVTREDFAGLNEGRPPSSTRTVPRRVPVRDDEGKVVGHLTADGFRPLPKR